MVYFIIPQKYTNAFLKQKAVAGYEATANLRTSLWDNHLTRESQKHCVFTRELFERFNNTELDTIAYELFINCEIFVVSGKQLAPELRTYLVSNAI